MAAPVCSWAVNWAPAQRIILSPCQVGGSYQEEVMSLDGHTCVFVGRELGFPRSGSYCRLVKSEGVTSRR